MRALILSSKDDNGGIGAALARAVRRQAPHVTIHSVTRSNNWIGFEPDILWLYGDDITGEYVSALYSEADVVHVMDTFDAADWHPEYDDKPKVFHHHGVDFKGNPQRMMEGCRDANAKQIVATHDLLRHGRDLEWFPNPCNIDQLQRIRNRNTVRSSFVRVVQTPAGRDKNGTDILLDGIDSLTQRVLDKFELDIIEGVPWDLCMERKAAADVMFDSFDVGYGISTLEAWGMAIPVIHGGDEQTEDAVTETMGFTPYYHATPKTIGRAVQAMVEDAELRQEYAEKGWQAVNDFHSEEAVVRNLLRIYEEVLG